MLRVRERYEDKINKGCFRFARECCCEMDRKAAQYESSNLKGWLVVCVRLFFFFSSRRRHTRFDCDWSSDVCSSDLMHGSAGGGLYRGPDITRARREKSVGHLGGVGFFRCQPLWLSGVAQQVQQPNQIGRASCRERV